MSLGAGMCNGAFNFYLSTLHVNQISNDLKLPSHTLAIPCFAICKGMLEMDYFFSFWEQKGNKIIFSQVKTLPLL